MFPKTNVALTEIRSSGGGGTSVSRADFLFRFHFRRLFSSLLLRNGLKAAHNALNDSAGRHWRETSNTLTRYNVLGHTHTHTHTNTHSAKGVEEHFALIVRLRSLSVCCVMMWTEIGRCVCVCVCGVLLHSHIRARVVVCCHGDAAELSLCLLVAMLIQLIWLSGDTQPAY